MKARDSNTPIEAITLISPAGMEVTLLNIGARIHSIRVPTKSGVVNAVLSHPNLDDYLHDNCYLGATVGRFANRIGNARFPIGGTTFSVDPNDGGNCLHGGREGFDRQFWPPLLLGLAVSCAAVRCVELQQPVALARFLDVPRLHVHVPPPL